MASLHETALDPGADNPRESFEKSKEASKHFESSSPDPNSRRFSLSGNSDGLKRDLSNRKVQLVAIGGSIGTALFLSIGGVLNKAGPGSLFLAFLVYNIMLALVNNCMAEMSVYMPVSGGFIRMAGKWVDEALGFMGMLTSWATPFLSSGTQNTNSLQKQLDGTSSSTKLLLSLSRSQR